MSNPGNTTPSTSQEPKQLLHLVFGGELTDLDSVTFRDLSKLDVVGIFPDYASASGAAVSWLGPALLGALTQILNDADANPSLLGARILHLEAAS